MDIIVRRVHIPSKLFGTAHKSGMYTAVNKFPRSSTLRWTYMLDEVVVSDSVLMGGYEEIRAWHLM